VLEGTGSGKAERKEERGGSALNGPQVMVTAQKNATEGLSERANPAPP